MEGDKEKGFIISPCQVSSSAEDGLDKFSKRMVANIYHFKM